jgi:hypothetical protein
LPDFAIDVQWKLHKIIFRKLASTLEHSLYPCVLLMAHVMHLSALMGNLLCVVISYTSLVEKIVSDILMAAQTKEIYVKEIHSFTVNVFYSNFD